MEQFFILCVSAYLAFGLGSLEEKIFNEPLIKNETVRLIVLFIISVLLVGSLFGS
jgi:hypothetical protein